MQTLSLVKAKSNSPGFFGDQKQLFFSSRSRAAAEGQRASSSIGEVTNESSDSTICAIGLLAFNPRVVYPCSRVYGCPRQERKKAKAVFIGQVVEVYSGSGRDDYPAIAELKVERFWKGIKKSETIDVLSDMGLHSCRAVLHKKGAKYMFMPMR